VQSDPVGLAGNSLSTFAYVDGDPLSALDHFGLARSGLEANRVRGNRYSNVVARDARKRCPSCTVREQFRVQTAHGARIIDVAIWKPGSTNALPDIAVEVKCGRNARRDRLQLMKDRWLRDNHVRTIEHHRLRRIK